jgi:hypothetical protein
MTGRLPRAHAAGIRTVPHMTPAPAGPRLATYSRELKGDRTLRLPVTDTRPEKVLFRRVRYGGVMPDSRKNESQDLEDYEVLDGSDTLDGNPGDDPLDRGVATPDRWSAGMRYALSGEEDSESLDELLDEEEPDVTDEDDEDSWDENETDGDVARLERDDDADPRAGRLAATEADVYGDGDVPAVQDGELLASDTGIDGGAASAEEAAVHVIDDPADQ